MHSACQVDTSELSGAALPSMDSITRKPGPTGPGGAKQQVPQWRRNKLAIHSP
jgi:hypothetical protein